VSPADPAAQTEFNQSYLGTLTGFPHESTVQVLLSGPLDPATVSAQNVVVVDVTAAAPVNGLSPAFDASANAIRVAPPPGGWTRAHQYAVALVAGQGRLSGAHGEPVIGSPTWALVSSQKPLVDCPSNGQGQPDLASAQCKPAVDVIPSASTDPAARLKEQTAKAIQLERIREGYAQILPQIEALANASAPAGIPILWTFTIVDAGEVTFDPESGIIPFPNDILRSKAGTVALPNPMSGAPLTAADCATASNTTIQLYCGLNTLDGFSTTVPPVSENGATTSAVAQARIDPSTLSTASVGLIPLPKPPSASQPNAPMYTPCLKGACRAAAGASPSSPQQLQWQLDAPLDETTTYLAYVTGDLKDDTGKNVIANPVFALLRLKNPLAVGGKSQVNVLTDAQASRLEPLRLAMLPALDLLEGNGVARANLTLAWGFTTQSEATALDKLYAYGAGTLPGLPEGIVIFADTTTSYKLAASAAGVSLDTISNIYVGVFVTPVAVTGPGGTLDPMHPKPEPVTFVLSVPDGTQVQQPAAGYPLTIFGHGVTRHRNDSLAIANSLAKAGQATIAIDGLFHGERSSCTGFGALMAASDDQACADPTTMRCNEDPLIGRCVARDDSKRVACPGLNVNPGLDPTGNLGCQLASLGSCAADGKCEGGDFKRDAGLRPTISGWNIFSLTSFFSTRDNFRQQVIDLARLIHTLRISASPLSLQARVAAAGGSAKLDLTKLGYVGQSLGGILGTLFNAVSPDTTNVVLNVAGGALPQIILTAPAFASRKALLLAQLAVQGIQPGTPAFDQFVGIAQWILDPADPVNMGWRLTHPIALPGGVMSPNPNRRALIQFIEGDDTVPNATTLALLAAAERPLSNTPPSFGCRAPLLCYEFTEANDRFDTMTVPLNTRHSFLLQPPGSTMLGLALTGKAQLQAATFLATGNLP
jgi:hypothetical protein